MANIEVHKKVYLIGAGPGDPELLTIKAVNALKRADAVLYDRLISKEILEYAPKSAEMIYVGKKKGNHSLPQEEICNLLIQLAFRYPYVARVKGGDPFIFGRGGEEYEAVTSMGLNCEVIPGITAATGAAAALGLSLTHRDYSSEVVLLTGHKQISKNMLTYPDFSKLVLKNKTHIIYMGLSQLESIVYDILKNNPGMENFPTMIVENATLPNQRAIVGTISNIYVKAMELKVTSPALVIIGEVIFTRNTFVINNV